jgi:hypothetical protein
MALKTNHAPGDPIKAEDMNSVVNAVVQNEHNIFELFLENFFSSKITPFLGLFFDGFSDTTKNNTTATSLTAQALSSQAILIVSNTTGFKVGHTLHIFDGSNQEKKIIQSVDGATQLTLTTNLANTFAIGSSVKRTSAVFDTANNKLTMASAGGNSIIEDFNALTLGNLNTQNSWSGNTTFQVQNSVVQEGANALDYASVAVGQTIDKSISSVTSDGAIFSLYMRSTSVGDGGSNTLRIIFFDGSTEVFRMDHPAQLTVGRINGDTTENLGTISANTWHKYEMEVDFTNNRARGRLDGGAFSAFVNADAGGSFTKIDKIRLSADAIDPGTGRRFFWDNITQTVPSVGDSKKAIYHSALSQFQQSLSFLKLWIVRNTGQSTGATSMDFERSVPHSLEITDAAQTGLDISGDLTFEAYVNLESFATGGRDSIIFSKVLFAGENRSYSFGIKDTLALKLIVSGTGTDATTDEMTSSINPTLTVGEWVHLAVTYDVSIFTATFYQNGVQLGTTKVGPKSISSIFNGTAKFMIGSQEQDGGGANLSSWDGKLAQVRVWNVIRTAGEILANKDKDLVGNETGLVGYWKLRGNILDETSNNNDLTNNNSTPFVSDVPFVISGDLNLKASIVVGATTLKIAGDQTGRFSDGDTIDIYDENNFVRERKTISGTPTFLAGETTITFTSAIVNSSGFDTNAIVERVDVIPKVSLVNRDASENFAALTFNRSEVDFVNGEVEDEYELTLGTGEEDLVVQLILTRNDTALTPFAKRLGVVLNA